MKADKITLETIKNELPRSLRVIDEQAGKLAQLDAELVEIEARSGAAILEGNDSAAAELASKQALRVLQQRAYDGARARASRLAAHLVAEVHALYGRMKTAAAANLELAQKISRAQLAPFFDAAGLDAALWRTKVVQQEVGRGLAHPGNNVSAGVDASGEACLAARTSPREVWDAYCRLDAALEIERRRAMELEKLLP